MNYVIYPFYMIHTFADFNLLFFSPVNIFPLQSSQFASSAYRIKTFHIINLFSKHSKSFFTPFSSKISVYASEAFGKSKFVEAAIIVWCKVFCSESALINFCICKGVISTSLKCLSAGLI